MGEKVETGDGRLSDLQGVYDILQRDAKDMANDLLSGVSMWRSASIICFMLASFAVACGVLVVVYVGLNQEVIAVNVQTHTKFAYEQFKEGVLLVAAFLYGVGASAVAAGIHYLRRYSVLRSKYSDLQAMLEKL
jgi:hypothetical protein